MVEIPEDEYERLKRNSDLYKESLRRSNLQYGFAKVHDGSPDFGGEVSFESYAQWYAEHDQSKTVEVIVFSRNEDNPFHMTLELEVAEARELARELNRFALSASQQTNMAWTSGVPIWDE